MFLFLLLLLLSTSLILMGSIIETWVYKIIIEHRQYLIAVRYYVGKVKPGSVSVRNGVEAHRGVLIDLWLQR